MSEPCPICGHKHRDSEAETTKIKEKLRAKAFETIEKIEYFTDGAGKEYRDHVTTTKAVRLDDVLAVLRGHDAEHKQKLQQFKAFLDTSPTWQGNQIHDLKLFKEIIDTYYSWCRKQLPEKFEELL